MSRSGETRLGLTDSQSAQTHPLECTVHYDDDESHDSKDDNGHPQKNSPKYVRKEVLVGTIAPVLNPPESLKRVFGSAEVLKLLPWHVQWMMIGYL